MGLRPTLAVDPATANLIILSLFELALVRSEVEIQVEQEVVERLANMSSKGCSS